MEGKSHGEELMCAYLNIMFPFEHIDNFRPDWLRNPATGFNLELDRYYPAYYIGFEFHGDQHFRQTDLESERQRKNDELKRKLCIKHHVLLVELKAIDLQTGVLYHRLQKLARAYKINRGFIGYKTPTWNPASIPHHQKNLWQLDHEATKYRNYLRERFPANVTTHKQAVAKRNYKKPWIDTYKPTTD